MKRELSRRWLLPLLALCFAAGLLLGRASGSWHAAALGALAAAAGMLCARRMPGARRVCLLALALCLGCARGYGAWHRALPEARTWQVRGIVVDEIRAGSREGSHQTVLGSVTLDGKPWAGDAYWSFYGEELPEGLAPGAAVSGEMRLYVPSGASNPGGFDFREYLLQRGIHIGLYGMENLALEPERHSLAGVAAALRHQLLEGLRRVMGEEQGDLAGTMLLGVRSLLPTDDRDAFARLGIAHLLSVSGFHVGVLWLGLSALLRRLRLPRAARLALLTGVIGLYCLMTGMGAPVVRAAVLLLLREAAVLRRRPAEPLHLLSAAALLTLLWQPAQVLGMGFHLSYGALLGITLTQPLFRRITGRVRGRVRRRLAEGFSLALSVQLGILLPQLYWVQELPVLSLLLNTLLIGLAGVLLGLLWAVLLLMGVPGLGPLLGQLAAWACAQLTAGARWAAAAPWITLWTRQANVWTALGCLGLLLGLCGMVRLGRRRRALLTGCALALTLFSLVPWPQRGLVFTQLSLGDADAAVLRENDTVWAIDAGENATLATWLHQRRLGIDTLILTHLHRDHCQGLEALMRQRIPIGRIVLAEGAEQADLHEDIRALWERVQASGIPIERAARGDVLALPEGEIAVLWPERGRIRPGSDANDSSLALLVQIRGTRLLTCGDLTERGEPFTEADADIVKLSHHGSATSNTDAWLAAASPEVCLLSGESPDRAALWQDRLGEIPLWSTQAHGAITIRFGDQQFAISGYLPE